MNSFTPEKHRCPETQLRHTVVVSQSPVIHGITVWEAISCIIAILLVFALVNFTTNCVVLCIFSILVVCIGCGCLCGKSLNLVLYLAINLVILFAVTAFVSQQLSEFRSGNLYKQSIPCDVAEKIIAHHTNPQLQFSDIFFVPIDADTNEFPIQNTSYRRVQPVVYYEPEDLMKFIEASQCDIPKLKVLTTGQTCAIGIGALLLLTLLFSGCRNAQMPYLNHRRLEAHWTSLDFEHRKRITFWQVFCLIISGVAVMTVIHLALGDFLAGIPSLILLVFLVILWILLKPQSILYYNSSVIPTSAGNSCPGSKPTPPYQNQKPPAQKYGRQVDMENDRCDQQNYAKPSMDPMQRSDFSPRHCSPRVHGDMIDLQGEHRPQCSPVGKQTQASFRNLDAHASLRRYLQNKDPLTRVPGQPSSTESIGTVLSSYSVSVHWRQQIMIIALSFIAACAVVACLFYRLSTLSRGLVLTSQTGIASESPVIDQLIRYDYFTTKYQQTFNASSDEPPLDGNDNADELPGPNVRSMPSSHVAYVVYNLPIPITPVQPTQNLRFLSMLNSRRLSTTDFPVVSSKNPTRDPSGQTVYDVSFKRNVLKRNSSMLQKFAGERRLQASSHEGLTSSLQSPLDQPAAGQPSHLGLLPLSDYPSLNPAEVPSRQADEIAKLVPAQHVSPLLYVKDKVNRYDEMLSYILIHNFDQFHVLFKEMLLSQNNLLQAVGYFSVGSFVVSLLALLVTAFLMLSYGPLSTRKVLGQIIQETVCVNQLPSVYDQRQKQRYHQWPARGNWLDDNDNDEPSPRNNSASQHKSSYPEPEQSPRNGPHVQEGFQNGERNENPSHQVLNPITSRSNEAACPSQQHERNPIASPKAFPCDRSESALFGKSESYNGNHADSADIDLNFAHASLNDDRCKSGSRDQPEEASLPHVANGEVSQPETLQEQQENWSRASDMSPRYAGLDRKLLENSTTDLINAAEELNALPREKLHDEHVPKTLEGRHARADSPLTKYGLAHESSLNSILANFNPSEIVDRGVVEEYIHLGTTNDGSNDESWKVRIPSLIGTIRRLNDMTQNAPQSHDPHQSLSELFPIYAEHAEYNADGDHQNSNFLKSDISIYISSPRSMDTGHEIQRRSSLKRRDTNPMRSPNAETKEDETLSGDRLFRPSCPSSLYRMDFERGSRSGLEMRDINLYRGGLARDDPARIHSEEPCPSPEQAFDMSLSRGRHNNASDPTNPGFPDVRPHHDPAMATDPSRDPLATQSSSREANLESRLPAKNPNLGTPMDVSKMALKPTALHTVVEPKHLSRAEPAEAKSAEIITDSKAPFPVPAPPVAGGASQIEAQTPRGSEGKSLDPEQPLKCGRANDTLRESPPPALASNKNERKSSRRGRRSANAHKHAGHDNHYEDETIVHRQHQSSPHPDTNKGAIHTASTAATSIDQAPDTVVISPTRREA